MAIRSAKIKPDAFSQVASVIHKLPPQNIEAEQSLLGALLIDKDAIVEIAEQLGPEHFYRTDQHGSIFSAILELYEKREPIDLVTLTEKLKQKGLLDRVGGTAYLTELVNMVPTAAHINSYCRIIKEHALRRGLIAQSTRFIDKAYDESVDVAEIIEESEQSIFALSQAHIKRDFIQLKDALAQSFDRLDEIQKNAGKLRGVPTGFRDLDSKLAGMQDSNLIIFAARPGMGKCLAYDSKIINPETGALMTIQDYYQRQIKKILTLNPDLKIEKATISNFVDDGQKPVFLIKTALGKEIEVTASHPFLTIHGWKKLSELAVGQRIALPRAVPVFGELDLEDYKVKLLAYFLSDGGLTQSGPSFTNVNSRIAADFTKSIKMFGGVTVKRYDSSGTRAPSYYVIKAISNQPEIRAYSSQIFKDLMVGQKVTQRTVASQLAISTTSISLWSNDEIIPQEHNLLLLSEYFSKTRDFFAPNDFWGFTGKNKVTKWLEEQNLMGKSALEKKIPEIVYLLPKAKIALFLNRLFSCDGAVCINLNQKRQLYNASISYASSSKELISGVQHLLLRFGILSKVRAKKVKFNNKSFFSFELEILNSEDTIKFIKEIGIFGKEEKCLQALKIISQKNTLINYSKDSLPIEVWDQILKIKGNQSWRALYQKMGLPVTHNIHAAKSHPRRSTVLKLAKALNSIELHKLASSDIFWDKIVSITYSGLKQVYDLTIPQTHNFVANDFFVHNTSFALNVAQHVAVNANMPVGIFSLEMSQEELVDRLLVAQADIDAWKLKTGRLDEKDFDRLSHAMGQLAEAPLFIDDTPGASLSEIRTKARRLQAEHGLKFIVIDYLQLIQTKSYADNRVQQVSEISQGLKNLARELKVPILALSQLNRSVENRGGNKKPMLADLRESGCLAGDTLLMRADTGALVPIKELVGQEDIPIASLTDDLKLETRFISRVFKSGRKPTFLLKTRNGRSIKATANHPFFTIEGWKRLDQLVIGMRVGQPRLMKAVEQKSPLSDKEVILLAHLIGDGCVLPRQPIHYTSADPKNIKVVIDVAESLFNIKPKVVKQSNWWHVYLPSPYRLTHGKFHPITKWFRELGIEKVRSYEKVLPNKLFECSPETIRLFLHHLWATDGNISWKQDKGRSRTGAIYYATSSSKLANQVQHLLLRLGILSTIRIVPQRTIHSMYNVYIQGSKQQINFCQLIGSYGLRGEIVSQLTSELGRISANPNLDVLPRDSWQVLIKPEKELYKLGWRDVSTMLDIQYCGSTLFKSGISRNRLNRLAVALSSKSLLNYANSDIHWDEIVSITALGVEDVYDATVPQTHNFVANDFVVHNSIEQDSDVVMFIYREDDEKREQVKLDIQKHRNGAPGEIDLIFRGDRMKFYGMEKMRTRSPAAKAT